jgi:hypothetical protein
LAFWKKRWPHKFILNLTDLYYSSLMVWLDGPRTIIKTSLISHLLIWYMVGLKRVATNWVLEVLMGQWIKPIHTVFNSDFCLLMRGPCFFIIIPSDYCQINKIMAYFE